MTKQVILTGLRANNDLHLGNYFGALLPFTDMANTKAGEFQLNLFVPDLHSFTTPIDHTQLYQTILNNLYIYTAAGLDLSNPDIFIYRQSFIPAHSELTWILDCFTGFGEMSRMTQFKEKRHQLLTVKGNETLLSKNDQSTSDSAVPVTVGLFNYPVLMAADILLYSASYVPVGDDQSQHIEFTRDIAERINAKFGDIFVLPKAVKEQHEFFGSDQGLRIRDLSDPVKKMSKSDATGKGVIFLSDSPDAARQKIMSATTDSLGVVEYDYAVRPGVSNLLDIYKLLGGSHDEFTGQTSYGPLKSAVTEKVSAFLKEFQSKLATVNQESVLRKLESSEAAMNIQANDMLHKVQQALGLRPVN